MMVNESEIEGGGGRLWSPKFLDIMENWKMRYRSYPIWLVIRVDNEGGGG